MGPSCQPMPCPTRQRLRCCKPHWVLPALSSLRIAAFIAFTHEQVSHPDFMSYKIQEPRKKFDKKTIIHVLEDTIVSEATSSSLSNQLLKIWKLAKSWSHDNEILENWTFDLGAANQVQCHAISIILQDTTYFTMLLNWWWNSCKFSNKPYEMLSSK